MDGSNRFAMLALEVDEGKGDEDEPQNFFPSTERRPTDHTLDHRKLGQGSGHDQEAMSTTAYGNIRHQRDPSGDALTVYPGAQNQSVSGPRDRQSTHRGGRALGVRRGGTALANQTRTGGSMLQPKRISLFERTLTSSQEHGKCDSRNPTLLRPQPSNTPQNVFGDTYPVTRTNFPRVVPMNISINTQKEDHRLLKGEFEHSVVYLREKPDNEKLLSIEGVFLWPSEETGVEPIRAEDPRLDEIRKRQQCHMIMATNPKRLCIYGTHNETAEDAITGALYAIRTLFQESLHRGSRCLRFILGQPPQTVEWPPNIRMISAHTQNIASSRASGIGETMARVAMAELPVAAYQDRVPSASLILRKNLITLEMALSKGLERLVLSPGHVEIKALIGCFLFNRMANPPKGLESTPISVFLGKLRDTKSQGLLLRLSPEADLFGRVCARNDLFTAFIRGKSCALETIKPTYAGVFTFGAPGGPDAVDRQLTVETKDPCNDDGTLSIGRRAWTSPYEHSGSRRLEAFVANLEGGLSWKLEAVAQPYCRNIGDTLVRFQAKVGVDKVTSASNRPGSTELMFQIPQTYGLKDFYQRTRWNFCSRVNHNWVFQVSRLDRFDLSPSMSGHSAGDSQKRRSPVHTEWEACIFDERWGEILGNNGALSLGERADWVPSIAGFFPTISGNDKEEKHGFKEFVLCVSEICRGISEAKPW